MKTLKHRLPDGSVATRKTYREYTHVVVVQNQNGTYRVASWHMTESAARARCGNGVWSEKVNHGEIGGR
jgi:hypothetical protein